MYVLFMCHQMAVAMPWRAPSRVRPMACSSCMYATGMPCNEIEGEEGKRSQPVSV